MLRRAIFWGFSGQFATFALSFAGSVAIARLLSPRELGIYAVAIAVVGILQIATSFGTAAYVLKEAVLDEYAIDTAFTVNALLSALLAGFLYLGSFPAARFLEEESVVPILQLLALTPLISILEFRPSAMLQREMRFKAISLITTAKAAGSVVTTVTAAVAGASFMSPAYGALVATAIGAIGFVAAGREHVSLSLSYRGWRPMTIFGLQMMSVSGVGAASARLCDIVMGRLLGLEALGLFARANNLSSLLFTNVYGTATRIVFAKLSQDFRERGIVRDTFLTSLRIVSAVMGPLTIGLAVLSMPIVFVLYGEKWIAVAPILSILMVAQFLSLSTSMNWELFVIRNQLGTQTKLEISKSVFGLVTFALGCLVSIIDAAVVYILGALFSYLLYAPHVRRLADANRGELGGIYLETSFLTVIAVAPSFLLMLLTGWSAKTPLLLVATSIVVGASLWLVALFRIGHPIAGEVALVATRLTRSGQPSR